MDPITLVVTAVALGASAGLKDAAAQAVKDAYAGLKRLLGGRQVDVSGVERKPDSPAQRAALQETLTDVGGVDDEVVAAAHAVTAAVATHDPDTARVVGVNLHDLQAEFVKIGSVTSFGDGVVADGVRLSGGFTVDEVRAGVQEGDRPSPR
jgi:catalase (peroxidase I)